MLQVKVDGGSSIAVPPFCGKLSFMYKSKNNGKDKICRISPGPGPTENLYYAFFDEDDVDFQVKMDNSFCKDRSISYEMEVLEKKYGFVMSPGKSGQLETLESNGKKLHFIRQSGEEGKSLVSSTASTRGLSLQDSSLLLSQIKFQLSYSKLPSYTIKVKLPNYNLDVQVDQLTTMAHLKSKIAKRIDHPPSNFILSWKGREPNEKLTMESLRIEENSQIDVISVVFPVQIEMNSMILCTLKISSWDTINDLKKNIEEAQGIPAIQQKLVFNEKDLKNGRSILGESNIIPNCKIQLTVANVFPLEVKLVPSNKIFTVLVCSRYTLNDIYEKLQKTHEAPSNRYQRFFAQKEEVFESQMLEDIGITDSCKVFMVDVEKDGPEAKKMKKNVHKCQVRESFTIPVKLVDKTVVSLSVCPSETVEELKEKIKEKLGRPVQSLLLTTIGQQNEIILFDKNLPIEVYEISERSEIREVAGICIAFVTQDSKMFPVVCSPRNKIYTIKMLLLKKVPGMTRNSHRIIFDWKQLWDEARTLEDYNIRDGDILDVYREEVGGGGCGGCNNEDCSCHTVTMTTVGERGAITFGEKSRQTFSTVRFKEDELIKVKPFTVELRLAAAHLLD